MLRKKNLMIYLTAATLCFAGIASANTVTYFGDCNDVHYDDEAQFLIDCYMGDKGDAWSLQWDCLEGTTRWKFVEWTGALLSESIMKAGAVDTFLKIDGVPGDSTDDKRADWIEVVSFSHGVSQMAVVDRSISGAVTEGRCDHHQDFSIVKELDKASPLLNLNCCNGTHIDKMTLEMCLAGGDKTPYMKYEFEDVVVSSVSIGGGGGGTPTESVTFNYNKINWIYVETDVKTGVEKGEVKICWDLSADKGGS